VPYGGNSVAGIGYQICSDFSINRGYPLPQQGDADAADWITAALVRIDADIAAILGEGSGGGGGGTPILLAQKQIAYWNQGLKGDNDLAWDDASNRFGIGTLLPTNKVHIKLGASGVDGLLVDGLQGIDAFVGVSDGTRTVKLRMYNSFPCLDTDAQSFRFYDTNVERMRLDNGRLLMGDASMIGGGSVEGDIVVRNGRTFRSHDVAGVTAVGLIRLNSANQVVLSPDGMGIYWGIGMTALGGGAIATMGPIGGVGPAVSAQSGWLKGTDVTGTFYIPIWR